MSELIKQIFEEKTKPEIVRKLQEQDFKLREHEYENTKELEFVNEDSGWYCKLCITFDYKSGKYGVDIFWADYWEEIETSDTITEHDYIPDEWKELPNEKLIKKLDKIDQQAVKEITKWNKKLFKSATFEVERIVVNKDCYLQIPHLHYYKGYHLSLTNMNSITFDFILYDVSQLLYLLEHIFDSEQNAPKTHS